VKGAARPREALRKMGRSQTLRLVVDRRVHAEELIRFEANVVRGPGADPRPPTGPCRRASTVRFGLPRSEPTGTTGSQSGPRPHRHLGQPNRLVQAMAPTPDHPAPAELAEDPPTGAASGEAKTQTPQGDAA
jgi:hypothetical protein